MFVQKHTVAAGATAAVLVEPRTFHVPGAEHESTKAGTCSSCFVYHHQLWLPNCRKRLAKSDAAASNGATPDVKDDWNSSQGGRQASRPAGKQGSYPHKQRWLCAACLACKPVSVDDRWLQCCTCGRCYLKESFKRHTIQSRPSIQRSLEKHCNAEQRKELDRLQGLLCLAFSELPAQAGKRCSHCQTLRPVSAFQGHQVKCNWCRGDKERLDAACKDPARLLNVFSKGSGVWAGAPETAVSPALPLPPPAELYGTMQSQLKQEQTQTQQQGAPGHSSSMWVGAPETVATNAPTPPPVVMYNTSQSSQQQSQQLQQLQQLQQQLQKQQQQQLLPASGVEAVGVKQEEGTAAGAAAQAQAGLVTQLNQLLPLSTLHTTSISAEGVAGPIGTPPLQEATTQQQPAMKPAAQLQPSQQVADRPLLVQVGPRMEGIQRLYWLPPTGLQPSTEQLVLAAAHMQLPAVTVGPPQVDVPAAPVPSALSPTCALVHEQRPHANTAVTQSGQVVVGAPAAAGAGAGGLTQGSGGPAATALETVGAALLANNGLWQAHAALLANSMAHSLSATVVGVGAGGAAGGEDGLVGHSGRKRVAPPDSERDSKRSSGRSAAAERAAVASPPRSLRTRISRNSDVPEYSAAGDEGVLESFATAVLEAAAEDGVTLGELHDGQTRAARADALAHVRKACQPCLVAGGLSADEISDLLQCLDGVSSERLVVFAVQDVATAHVLVATGSVQQGAQLLLQALHALKSQR